MDVEKICCFCNEKISKENICSLRRVGLESLIKCSQKRNDGKHDYFQNASDISFHKSCREKYVNSKYIKIAKRKNESSADHQKSPKKCRSSGTFNFESNCFFCGNYINKQFNTKAYHTVESTEFKQNLLKHAIVRNDSWGREVFSRIAGVALYGLLYHHACRMSFFSENKTKNSTPGRPVSGNTLVAMNIIYKYLEENDDSQFALSELALLVQHLSVHEKTIKAHLLEHYGDDIHIFCDKHKCTIVCFKNIGHKILSDNWYFERETLQQDEKQRIVLKAAEILREEIVNTCYETNSYPSTFEFLNDVNTVIPKYLDAFLDTLIVKNKSKHTKSLKRKCITIGHAIIAAMKPRSFNSNLFLAIGSFMYQKVGSKTLINVLAQLGICCSYHDIKTIESSLVMSEMLKVKPESFMQFAFDNCDFNVNTIDGHNTFHNMAGVLFLTPKNSIENSSKRIEKVKRLKNSELVEKKGITQVKHYNHPSESGLAKYTFEDLDNLYKSDNHSEYPELCDIAWMACKHLSLKDFPGWFGYMSKITQNMSYEMSEIITLPFVMAPPSDYDTIFTCMTLAIEQGKKCNLKAVCITFDLPLYLKAQDIVLSVPEESPLKNVVVRLGGFHLIMSFLGCIGNIMTDSGLTEMLSLIYAGNSVKHILNGHAYARAIRAHVLVGLAMSNIILQHIDITEEEKSAVCSMFAEFSETPPSIEDIESNVQIKSLKSKFEHKLNEITKENGPTAQLWVQYYKMITLMKHFIEAERTGDWNKHLYTVKLMMPYFHSSGHIHYAKACQIYLQEMSKIQNIMSTSEFESFTEGFFTIRRTNNFFSGTWTDMVIEQTANREFKVLGGIVQRGFTDEILSTYVITKPAFATITTALEGYCNTTFRTSEQHIELRESRISRNDDDTTKILGWIIEHQPFFNTTKTVTSLGTGIIGDQLINCHEAKNIGERNMKGVVGKQYKDVILKRCDKVRCLNSMNSSINIKEKNIPLLDPLILYQRMLTCKESIDNLSEYLKYEIAPYPMSLFTSHGMKKTAKSALFDEFQCCADDDSLTNADIFVIDGGFLLHYVRWNFKICKNYKDVCNLYVQFVIKQFKSAVVVFDGYSNQQESLKQQEQNRRYRTNAPKLNITEESPLYVQQEKFLRSSHNKIQIINMLKTAFEANGIQVRQATDDADFLIVKTAIEKCSALSTVIVGQDIDLLVILINLAPTGKEIFFCKYKRGNVKTRLYSPSELAMFKRYITLAHSFSGCDTTSSIHGKGKKQLVKIFQSDKNLDDVIAIFNNSNSQNSDVEKAGEKLFLALFGCKDDSKDLNEFRYHQFQKSLLRKTANLELLPPTKAAAAQHSYRVYLQVQIWKGNHKNPLEWGWERKNNCFVPVRTLLEAAPEKILHLISCGCTTDCTTLRCKCYKSGLKCTIICKNCMGTSCQNSETLGTRTNLVDDCNNYDSDDYEDCNV